MGLDAAQSRLPHHNMTVDISHLSCLVLFSSIQCNGLSLHSAKAPFVQVAASTIPGSDPERPSKVNQDACFSNGQDFVCVMDGHGTKGHLITRFLEAAFPQRLSQYLPVQVESAIPFRPSVSATEYQDLLAQQRKDIKDLANFEDWPVFDAVAEGLADAFLAAHLDARIDPSVPTGRSGTTAIVAFVSSNTGYHDLYIAGVGDSSAMLLDDTGRFHDILPKSTLEIESERHRIERCKGSIVGSNVFFGPVGIAMTRALGDSVMLPAGVVPIPLVERFNLERTRRYAVCLGSDGLFDVLSYETVASIIRHSNVLNGTSHEDETVGLQLLTERICNEAVLAWKKDLPIEPSIDDITCALMLLSV